VGWLRSVASSLGIGQARPGEAQLRAFQAEVDPLLAKGDGAARVVSRAVHVSLDEARTVGAEQRPILASVLDQLRALTVPAEVTGLAVGLYESLRDGLALYVRATEDCIGAIDALGRAEIERFDGLWERSMGEYQRAVEAFDRGAT
jgi:hypothetical protein